MTSIYVAPLSDEWFEARRDCVLTASEISPLLFLGYESRNELLRRKRFGVAKPVNPYQQAAMDHGRANEPHALQAFGRVMGDQGSLASTVPFFTCDVPGVGKIGATPDGIFAFNDGRTALVEAKCPLYARTLQGENEDKFWNYVIQMQVQMLCSGYKSCFLVFYCVAAGTCEVWEVDYSQEFIDSELIPALKEFVYYRDDPQMREFPRAKPGQKQAVLDHLDLIISRRCL